MSFLSSFFNHYLASPTSRLLVSFQFECFSELRIKHYKEYIGEYADRRYKHHANVCATLTKGLNELKSLLWWEEEGYFFLSDPTSIGYHRRGVSNYEKSLLIREKSEEIPKDLNKSLKILKNPKRSLKIPKNSKNIPNPVPSPICLSCLESSGTEFYWFGEKLVFRVTEVDGASDLLYQ